MIPELKLFPDEKIIYTCQAKKTYIIYHLMLVTWFFLFLFIIATLFTFLIHQSIEPLINFITLHSPFFIVFFTVYFTLKIIKLIKNINKHKYFITNQRCVFYLLNSGLLKVKNISYSTILDVEFNQHPWQKLCGISSLFITIKEGSSNQKIKITDLGVHDSKIILDILTPYALKNKN